MTVRRRQRKNRQKRADHRKQRVERHSEVTDATVKLDNGRVLATGAVNGVRVFASKQLRSYDHARTLQLRWTNRVCKQIEGGRKFA